jgi:hypothetical protein
VSAAFLPRHKYPLSFDRVFVFSALHKRFTFVHLFYSYLILLTGLFPYPFNTSWSPTQHRRAVCWSRLYNTSGGPSSILFTALHFIANSELHSEHTLAYNGCKSTSGGCVPAACECCPCDVWLCFISSVVSASCSRYHCCFSCQVSLYYTSSFVLPTAPAAACSLLLPAGDFNQFNF